MGSDSYFIFNGYEPSWNSGQVSFFYKLVRKEEEAWNFTDTLTFASPGRKFNIKLAELVLDSLSLIFGISYWKLLCPSDLRLPYHVLSEEQAEFWNIVYSAGLGEFYYKNKIDFRGKIHFPFSENKISSPEKISAKDRSLLLVGGGKDSIVSGELLKKHGKPFSSYMINPHLIQINVAREMGGEIIEMNHILDPQLFDLNKLPDVYNGHVPISIMYTLTAALSAALYDYRYIVASNESSADFGNLNYLGMDINHQWDKSIEAERLLGNYIHNHISPDITYFSILRPWSEIKIAGKFSEYTKYFDLFSSCNRNFTITEKARLKWCGECPKCAFVFAILSPFIPRATLENIFGRDLFGKIELLPTFKELLGIENIKPFECVGTPEETQLAFALAHEKGEYENELAMAMFLENFQDKLGHIKTCPLLAFSGDNFFPPAFKEILDHEA